MAANKKPRKPYKPKCRVGLPIRFGLSAEMKTDLRLPPHLILDAFRQGRGDEAGAHTLAACVNLGAVLSRKHPAEAQAVMAAGLAAVQSVMERGKSGKWGTSGDELRAIGEALTLTDDMQDCETRTGMRDAITEVYREAAI